MKHEMVKKVLKQSLIVITFVVVIMFALDKIGLIDITINFK